MPTAVVPRAAGGACLQCIARYHLRQSTFSTTPRSRTFGEQARAGLHTAAKAPAAGLTHILRRARPQRQRKYCPSSLRSIRTAATAPPHAPLFSRSATTGLSSNDGSGTSEKHGTARLRVREQRRHATRIAHLSDRGFVGLAGEDAVDFLKGVCTNTVPDPLAILSSSEEVGNERVRSGGAVPVAALGSTDQDQAGEVDGDKANHDPAVAGGAAGRVKDGSQGFYTAFLNAQGRVLFDAFLYPCSQSPGFWESVPEPLMGKIEKGGKKNAEVPAFLLEVDAEQTEALVKHLRRYKLRAKVEIWALEGEWRGFALWDDPHFSPFSSTSETVSPRPTDQDIGSLFTPTTIGTRSDPRHPSLGARLIVPPQTASTSPPPPYPNSPLKSYTHHRHLLSVPQGPLEIQPTTALPHEHNLDLLSAIDFRKGCYIGQELVVRTQHTGVVRKRVLPVRLYSVREGVPGENENENEKDKGKSEAGLLAKVAEWTQRDGEAPDIVPRGRRGRPAGRWIGGSSGDSDDNDAVDDVGLALCRVETMTDLVVSSEAGTPRYKPGDEFVLKRRRRKAEIWNEMSGKEQLKRELEWEDEDVADGVIAVRAVVPGWLRRGVRVR